MKWRSLPSEALLNKNVASSSSPFPRQTAASQNRKKKWRGREREREGAWRERGNPSGIWIPPPSFPSNKVRKGKLHIVGRVVAVVIIIFGKKTNGIKRERLVWGWLGRSKINQATYMISIVDRWFRNPKMWSRVLVGWEPKVPRKGNKRIFI